METTIKKLLKEIFAGNDTEDGSIRISEIRSEDCKSVPFSASEPVYKVAVLSVTDPETTRFISYVGMHENGEVALWATSFLRKENAEAILSRLPDFDEMQGNGTFFSEFNFSKPKSAFKKVINKIGEIQTDNLRAKKIKGKRVRYI